MAKRENISRGLNMWKNGIEMTPEEERHVALVRAAGCKCDLPLLGYLPNQGPRCRMCGAEAFEEHLRKEKWKWNGSSIKEKD